MINTKDLLARILKRLISAENRYEVERVTILDGSTSIAAGGYVGGADITYEKTGYYPVGIEYNSQIARIVPYRFTILDRRVEIGVDGKKVGKGRIVWGVFNVGSTSSAPTVYAYIIWEKIL